jgi:hypothetical protein
MVFQSVSVAVGRDGLGLISYHTFSAGSQLKVAHCSNVNCDTATFTTFGPGGDDNRITIGSDGLGLVAYRDSDSLKVMHCSNETCTSATTTTVDITGANTMYLSVTIGPDGFGLIAYRDSLNTNLKVAHLSNVFGVPFYRQH